jgi:large subunit ribosomal protein L25
MSDQSSTVLAVTGREPGHSRATRRLRRAGLVPGIVYGGDSEPIPFAIEARELRNTLARAGAVIELTIDGGKGTPVVLKDLVRHPVTSETVHIDLLRVNLNVAIQTQVTIELTGGEDSPGVKEGGVLEQILREVTVEALPNSIPDSLSIDVSHLDIGSGVTLAELTLPAGVTLIGELDALVANVSQTRANLAEDADEVETETELVGEEAAAESDGAGDSAE